MKYFKNTELAKLYHVSEKSVRNWIEAAEAGKLDLQLFDKNDKKYIANVTANTVLIQELVRRGKKFKNKRGNKTIWPKAAFYKTYTQEQIYDIVTNLEMHREILRQYNYFDGGTEHWDLYVRRMENEQIPNLLNMTQKLLSKNEAYIDDLMGKYQKVNIVDIGAGNALPAKNLIAHFLENGKLGRYIPIDISPEMLQLAKRNIETWFGDAVVFEGYQRDITRDRFAGILAGDYIKNTAQHTGNLILFLGGTLQNFRKRDIPLQVINDSMGANDFLIHTQKLDSLASRRYFDFNSEPRNTSLSPNHRLIFDLFNIDEDFYDVEMGYDSSADERYIRIRLKVALNINFKFDNGERELAFNKGESILLWRASQDKAIDIINQFDRNDFYVLQSSQTEDQEYILTLSRVKRDAA